MAINDQAPVITREEIVIEAPLEQIWNIQVDVGSWPQWQPEVTAAVSDGPLEVGSSFRWQTAGLDITSTVTAVDRHRHIEWGGPANGITAVHVWNFEQTDHGVRVATEESWEGVRIEEAVHSMQKALDDSLQAWLTNLKDRAER